MSINRRPDKFSLASAVLVACALLATTALAQDDSEEEKAPEPVNTPATVESTEKISEDLSVPFPTDI